MSKKEKTSIDTLKRVENLQRELAEAKRDGLMHLAGLLEREIAKQQIPKVLIEQEDDGDIES